MLRTLATKAWHSDCVNNVGKGGAIDGDRAAGSFGCYGVGNTAMVIITEPRAAIAATGDFGECFSSCGVHSVAAT